MSRSERVLSGNLPERALEQRPELVDTLGFVECGRKLAHQTPNSLQVDQTRRRGRPPRRPFARELAAFRRLVRLPTSAAALTSATLGLLPLMDDLTVATFTFADEDVPG